VPQFAFTPLINIRFFDNSHFVHHL